MPVKPVPDQRAPVPSVPVPGQQTQPSGAKQINKPLKQTTIDFPTVPSPGDFGGFIDEELSKTVDNVLNEDKLDCTTVSTDLPDTNHKQSTVIHEQSSPNGTLSPIFKMVNENTKKIINNTYMLSQLALLIYHLAQSYPSILM